MIKPLRKRHRIIWLVLFVVVSVLFIESYKSPGLYTEENDKSMIDSLSFIESVSAAGANYDATVGTLQSGEKVLQLNLKVLFRSPVPGVYLVPENSNDVAEYRLLGEVNRIGNYQFKFDAGDRPYQLMVYDPVKKTKLETLNFQ